MITPNKFISYANSSLSQVDKIFKALDDASSISELYKKVSRSFKSIEDFMFAVEILHLTDIINIDFPSGRISKC
jgi:hypothetical protein